MMFDLERFVQPQLEDFDTAMSEIKAGRKRSHWIWYMFPQYVDLGRSSTAKYYGIGSLMEASAYLSHPVLGANLVKLTQALLDQSSRDAHRVMGFPDDLKLKSSMTLFKYASAAFPDADNANEALFAKVLDEFFDGEECQVTLEIPLFPEA